MPGPQTAQHPDAGSCLGRGQHSTLGACLGHGQHSTLGACPGHGQHSILMQAESFELFNLAEVSMSYVPKEVGEG